MEVSKQINDLIEKYRCTAKELANASDLSVSVISRYRNGTRRPSKQQLQKLAKGFEIIARQHGEEFDLSDMDTSDETDNMDMFIRKFNILVSALDINMSDFARFSNYDPSFISRVRSKQRNIADSDSFAEKIGEFLNLKYRNEKYDSMISALMENAEMTETNEKYINGVREWFLSDKISVPEHIIKFPDTDTRKLYDICLPEFNDVRSYTGRENVCRGELDFLRYVLAENDTKELYLFNEMPHFILRHEQLADEWIYLMSEIIKKGISVIFVYNIERPFNDITMAVEKMFPLFISGGLRPFYLTTVKSGIYYHICGCTDKTVMYGEGVYGNETHVKLNIDRTSESVKYYRKEMKVILQKSRPLLNIYTKENADTFRQFINADIHTFGERRGLWSSFPIWTMTKEFLLSVLDRQCASQTEIEKIIDLYDHSKANVTSIIKSLKINEQMMLFEKEEFEKEPLGLSVSGAFLERPLFYNDYEEYLEHKKLTLEFAERYKNYIINFSNRYRIRNIDILIQHDKWVIISKNGCQPIQFIIRNPKIRRAFEEML